MAKRADLAALTAAALEADDLGQIDAALEAVAAALPEAEKAAETAEAAALDPRAKDVAQARRKADDARFEAKRLAAAHDALADHRAAVEAAQVEARRVGEYDLLLSSNVASPHSTRVSACGVSVVFSDQLPPVSSAHTAKRTTDPASAVKKPSVRVVSSQGDH